MVSSLYLCSPVLERIENMGHMSLSCLTTYCLSIHNNTWSVIGVGILLWDSSPWLLSRLTFQTFCSIIGSTREDISSTSSAPTCPSTFSSELNQKLIAAFQTFWAVISWNPPKDHLPHSVPAPAAHQHDNFPQSIQWPTFSSSCCNQRQIQKTHTFHTITMYPRTIHAYFSNHFIDIFILNQTTNNPAS